MYTPRFVPAGIDRLSGLRGSHSRPSSQPAHVLVSWKWQLLPCSLCGRTVSRWDPASHVLTPRPASVLSSPCQKEKMELLRKASWRFGATASRGQVAFFQIARPIHPSSEAVTLRAVLRRGRGGKIWVTQSADDHCHVPSSPPSVKNPQPSKPSYQCRCGVCCTRTCCNPSASFLGGSRQNFLT